MKGADGPGPKLGWSGVGLASERQGLAVTSDGESEAPAAAPYRLRTVPELLDFARGGDGSDACVAVDILGKQNLRRRCPCEGRSRGLHPWRDVLGGAAIHWNSE